MNFDINKPLKHNSWSLGLTYEHLVYEQWIRKQLQHILTTTRFNLFGGKKRQLINHRKYDKNYLLNLQMLRLIIRNLYHENNNDDITCVTLLTLWPYLLLYGLINTISIIIISKKLLICGNPVIYRRFDSKLLLLSMKDYGKFQVLI